MSDQLAMMGTTKSNKTYADGSLLVSIIFPPEKAKEAYSCFGTPDVSVGVAVLTADASLQAMQDDLIQSGQPEYGQYAKKLRTKGFCFHPQVRVALGLSAENRNGGQQQVWDALKKALGYESMKHVPPTTLLAWAQVNGVENILPAMYRQE